MQFDQTEMRLVDSSFSSFQRYLINSESRKRWFLGYARVSLCFAM